MNKSVVKYLIIAAVSLVMVGAVVLILLLNRPIEVPNLEGKTIGKATALLEKLNLDTETQTEYSDTVKLNIVISQDVGAGTEVKRGTVITLTVSAGIEPVKVPDLRNKPLIEAEKTLADAGFKVSVVEEFSDTAEAGVVIRQSVKGGKTADKGSNIKLFISKGPDLVIVPNIKGMTLEKAEKTAYDAGLRLDKEIKCSNKVKEGNIISQHIKAGETAKRNSTVFVEVSGGVSNKTGNTSSNCNNSGIVATQGNWIYFSNYSNDYHLYKMRKDGSEKQLLDGKCVALSINVLGEWIYYTDETSGLCKIKIDGTEKTLLRTDVNYWLYVEDDWIYFSHHPWGGTLNRVKTDGSSAEPVITEKCRSINILNGWVYYINDSDELAYKIKTDGTGKTLISPGFGGSDLAIVDGKLMSKNGYYIQIVNLDGSGFSQIGETNISPHFLCGNDGWMYFLESDLRDRNNYYAAFYKMKSDGSQKIKVLEYDFQNKANFFINVADGWLYFPNENDNGYLYRVKTDGTGFQKAY